MAPTVEKASETPFRFYSPAGYALCRRILNRHLPYEPHDYQLEGIAKALDGIDVLAITPTGSGKSGYIYMYMLVACAISEDPSLCRSAKIPVDPAAVVVCPTKSLESDLELKIRKTGLRTIVLNGETVEDARKRSIDLWELARSGIAVIFVTPEKLTDQGFERLLEATSFKERVRLLVVDEVHLLYVWGVRLRPAFQQMGLMRARFPNHTVLLCMTATLRKGAPMDTVCSCMGLHGGSYHLIRRSNLRRDVRLIFRTLSVGLGGERFPDLDWVLRETGNTLIFARTIRLGWNILCYLWHKESEDKPPGDQVQRLRTHNALNWPDYNTETLERLYHGLQGQITIATNTLAVGIDVPNFDTVVILDPEDLDDLMQKAGRVGRRPSERCSELPPRAIVYISAETSKRAAAIVTNNVQSARSDGHSSAQAKKGKSRKAEGENMDTGLAHMIIAECKLREQNTQYDNPEAETPCSCTDCAKKAVVPPGPCNCSGTHCQPETIMPADAPAPAKGTSAESNPVPKTARLTTPMKAVVRERLEAFRDDIFDRADEASTALLPPRAFMSPQLIELLVTYLPLIHSVPELQRITGKWRQLDPHYDELLGVIQGLQADVARMREEKRLQHNLKARQRRQAAKARTPQDKQGDHQKGSEGSESESGAESDSSDSGDEASRGGTEIKSAETEIWSVSLVGAPAVICGSGDGQCVASHMTASS